MVRNILTDKKFCECGCGIEVKPTKRFRSGHFSKTRDFSAGNNPRFNGYRCKNQGYWLVRDLTHRFKDGRGYVYEHRLIWEKYNKAMLLHWGAVHHNNHIRDDNRIENLTGMMKLEHDRLESYIRKRDRFGRFS